MSKTCKTCDRYKPVCMLYGYFKNGKPHVDKVTSCENRGCDICKERSK